MATPEATARTYIAAAQTAIGDGDRAEAKKQLLLAQLELAKIPARERQDDLETYQRAASDIADLRAAIDDFFDESDGRQAVGRSVIKGI